VTFYGNYVKMCKGFPPNFGDKRTSCYITTMHHLTLPFSQKTTWLFEFSVSSIENRTQRPSFSHKWGDRGRIAGGAEHLTEHDFQYAFKKWQKH
jgi:hypothetical protein